MGAKKRNRGKSRHFARRFGIFGIIAFILYATIGCWYVRRPGERQQKVTTANASLIDIALSWIGDPVADLMAAIGLIGHDAIYEYDEEAPAGKVFFAGIPTRTSPNCPNDIQVIKRGDFAVGWSPSLRHPVWCAYHLTGEERFPVTDRPNFRKDRDADRCPAAGDYKGKGYDRGHMVPNYAIVTRYGKSAQESTFLMSNISPQSAELNRGVWREFEHRIADLWTKRYGEIWVIVGCVQSKENRELLSSTDIDVPEAFYQIIVAQEGLNVRALAVMYPQAVPWRLYPTRGIVTIDEIEELTGLDFLPELPAFIQDPLEAELPTRLWPINFSDIFRMFAIHFVS